MPTARFGERREEVEDQIIRTIVESATAVREATLKDECLGMLGGMVVAWFVAPTAADGLFKSLSPFALAFLAGYSIELVFAAMDRFIAAFTKPEAKSTY
jgi:hypothetical protein